MIKWKIQGKPLSVWTPRAWPVADYKDTGKVAAYITCATEYAANRVKYGDHAELIVHIADYRGGNSFVWQKLTKRFATLKDAKEATAKFLKNNKMTA